MAQLLCDGRGVAQLVVAHTVEARTRGLLGRDYFGGAMLLTPARSVHTLRMRFAIDVAHLDAHWSVIFVTTMQPNRIGRWVRGSRHVLEAAAGSFDAWGVSVGSRLEISEAAAA